MLIMARCTYQAWDSQRAVMYYAGEVCEIDTDSPLVSMTVPGFPKDYVFQFDRTKLPKPKVQSIMERA